MLKIAYEMGAEDALRQLGLEKQAFLPALMAAGRAAAPMLARAGGRALAGLRGAGRSMQAAGKAGWGAFAQQAPGAAQKLQTAGKVLGHPATQMGLIMAPGMVGGGGGAQPRVQ